MLRIAVAIVMIAAGAARSADPGPLLDTPVDRVTYDMVVQYHDFKQQQLANGRPLKPQRHKGQPVYFACQGYTPRLLPGNKADPNPRALTAEKEKEPKFQQTFLERVTLLIPEVQGEGAKFALIAFGETNNAANLKILGWVPSAYIIDRAECERDKTTKIHRKAMVVNALESLQGGGPGGDGAQLLRPPPYLFDLEHPTRFDDAQRFKFLDVFFVWADTDPNNDEKGYVLLGAGASINRNLTSANPMVTEAMIQGWVEKKRVAFWDTREGVRWNDKEPNRPPVETYKTIAEALAAARPNGPPREEPKIDEVFQDGKPTPWLMTRMCYPLLPFDPKPPAAGAAPGPGPREKVKERKYVQPDPDTYLYRIGVVGGIYNNNVKTLTEDERMNVVREIEKLQAQLDVTEVVFVIDRTASMAPVYKGVSGAVRRLVNKLQEDKKRTLRVAFCYYADLKDGQATLAEALRAKKIARTSFYEVSPAGGPQAAQGLKGLTAELAVLDEIARDEDKDRQHQTWTSGDTPEMMFAGLEYGITGGWQADSYARRLVVLIGDDGDHAYHAAGDDAKKAEAAAQQRIRGLLAGKAARTPIDFFVLHVGDPADQKGQAINWVTAFEEQTKGIVAALKADGGTAEYQHFPEAKKSTPEALKPFEEAIMKRYDQLRTEAKRYQDMLEQVRRHGHVTQIADPKLAAQYEKWAQDLARKLNKKDYRDLLDGAQAFDQRFVWLDNPTDVRKHHLRKMAFVSEAELEDVVDMLDKLYAPGRAKITLDTLGRATAALLRGDGDVDNWRKLPLTGDDNRLGLTFVSKLLELDQKDTAAVEELKLDLQKKWYRLRNIQAKNGRVQDVEWKKDDAGVEHPIPADPRPMRPAENRALPSRGGKSFYWIDIDEEWP